MHTLPIIPIINALQPTPTLLCGGQPTAAQLAAARDAGYTTIVNLRPDAELHACGIDELAQLAPLGLTYVSIPISGPADLNLDAAQRLHDAIEASSGGVVVHCASGNRVGALLALRAAWIQGATPQEALQFGEQSGLTSLAEAVANRLRNPPR